MKRFAITTAAALFALTGVASTQSAVPLTSASQVTLSTLAPELDTSALTPVQVRRINAEVASDSGLTASQIRTIVAH